MTQPTLREQEVWITRYRMLEREVTDPLAAGLLHGIVEELEAAFRTAREGELSQMPFHSSSQP